MDGVLKHWGLSNATITELRKSAHNSTWDVCGKYVLKHNPDTKQLGHLLDDWHSWIKPKLAAVNDEVVEQTEVRLNDLYKQLPRQLVHRDVHSQNVLLDNGVISGWLDFDHISRC